jgi:hypothetical protein
MTEECYMKSLESRKLVVLNRFISQAVPRMWLKRGIYIKVKLTDFLLLKAHY